MALYLSDEHKLAHIEMLQTHSGTLNSSMEDYHESNRAHEGYISVAFDE